MASRPLRSVSWEFCPWLCGSVPYSPRRRPPHKKLNKIKNRIRVSVLPIFWVMPQSSPGLISLLHNALRSESSDNMRSKMKLRDYADKLKD